MNEDNEQRASTEPEPKVLIVENSASLVGATPEAKQREIETYVIKQEPFELNTMFMSVAMLASPFMQHLAFPQAPWVGERVRDTATSEQEEARVEKAEARRDRKATLRERNLMVSRTNNYKEVA